MRTFFLIFCIISLNLKADYSPERLWEMALKADKIIYGEITQLRDKDYILKISNSATGDTGTIIIKRFNDWTCAQRWAKYEKGQMVVAFLVKSENTYHIMSAGGEGEMYVKNNIVNLSPYIINGDIKTVKSDLEINKFIQIIKDLRACYGVNKNMKNLPYKKTDCTIENKYSDKNANSLYICLKKEIEQGFKQ